MDLTVESLRFAIKDSEFQHMVIEWVEKVLRPLEDNDVYLKLCQASSTPITTQTVKLVIARFQDLIRLGTPAHELGHHERDALGGAALIAGDLFLRSGFRNDVDAAFWACNLHDGSTGVQHRYIDYEWELNHGELMAYLFFHLTQDLLSEPVRLLAAYAIAAHPHMLKDMTAKNGGVRRPWNDQLFYYNDRPVRLAVWVTRWTDRLENGGDPIHLVRHAMATTDGALVGGMDLHSVDWYHFADQLKYLFYPQATVLEIEVAGQIKRIPSVLQHLQGYRVSADPAKKSPYNQFDDLSPSMLKLMGWKSAKSIQLVDMVTNNTGEANFAIFKKLMRMVSGTPLSNASLKSIAMVSDIWDLSPEDDRSHWAKAFGFCQTSYYEWLSLLTDEIFGATDPTIQAFAPLVPKIVAKVTAF